MQRSEGWSFGIDIRATLGPDGVNAPIALAQEPRIRAAVVYVGFIPSPPPRAALEPSADPLNALPRVEIPVLLLTSASSSASAEKTAQLRCRQRALIGDNR